MKIFVKVKTKAKIIGLEKIGENAFSAKVGEAPEKGKANKAVIKLFSQYFKIPQQNIKIISGETSKTKVIQIID